MRTLLSVCLLFYAFTLPLSAQGFRFPWKKAATAPRAATPKKLSAWQISRQLEKRAANSFKQAKQAQAALGHTRPFAMGEPVSHMVDPQHLSAPRVYPDKPFLTSYSQVADYMTARSNRLFLQELRRMETVWADIDAHLPQLQQQAQHSPQPQEPMAWLAQQIPAQTSALFVGEIHGFGEIRDSMAQLLADLQAQQPDREIILFTEFLPENIHWEQPKERDQVPLYLYPYAPVWEMALQHHIPVVGLEPKHVVEDGCMVAVLNRNEESRHLSAWATLEGVRLRNKHWKGILQRYRTQYPEALFVIYTGAGHSLYTHPFTLADQLPQEHSFVAALYPDKYPTYENGGFLKSGRQITAHFQGPLERLTDPVEFPQPILQFTGEELPHLAGFDVRIKVPVSIDRYNLEHNH